MTNGIRNINNYFVPIQIGIVILLLLLNTTYSFSQYKGGSGGDSLHILGAKNYINCTPPYSNISFGGNSDGHALKEMIYLFCDTNMLYKGSVAGGSYIGTRNDIDCTPSYSSISYGGISDGHASKGKNYLYCDTNALYKGSVAGGSYIGIRNDISCTPSYSNISFGGISDGHTVSQQDYLNCGTDYLYKGGFAGGSYIGAKNDINCTPSYSSVSYGGISDGHAQDTSACRSVSPPCTVNAYAGVDDTICDNDSTVLTASGGLYYLWNTGETTADITVSPNSDSAFIVTVSDLICSDSDTVVVVVNPAPIVNITGIDTICYGDSTVLKASGGGNYLWSTGASIDSIYVSPIIDSAYAVTVTNAFLCVEIARDTIIVNPVPTAIITALPNDTLCSGFSDSLIASGAGAGGSYLWSDATTNDTNIVSPIVNTTYKVTVTNMYSCSDSDTVAVIVNPSPSASITGTDTICEGDSALLVASGAGAGGTYLWSTAETNDSIYVSAASTYTVTVTNIFSCSDIANYTVSGVISAAGITGTTTICPGQTTTLTATGGIAPKNYLWNTGETTVSIDVSPPSTANYYVTITDSYCTTSAGVTVTVNSPITNITGTDTICSGSSTLLTSDPGTSYLWSTGETTQSITVSPASTSAYIVTLTDAASCTAIASKVVTVIEPAGITGTTTICPGVNTTLTATGGMSPQSYLWSTTETTISVTVAPASDSTFYVTVTDAYCTTNVNVTVTVLGACTSINVAAGGISDGHSMGNINYLTCNTNIPYLGGMNDGLTIGTKNDIDCTPTYSDVAYGGISDGHSLGIDINLYCNANIPYLGGYNDGGVIGTKNDIDCTPTYSTVSYGGISDGHSKGFVNYLYCNLSIPYLGGFSDGGVIGTRNDINCTPAPLSTMTGGSSDGSSGYESPFCMSTSPLPIQLIDFTATLIENNDVLLEWQTATEINNDFFTVQRTLNRIDYEKVGIVDGAGNSIIPIYYYLVDKTPYIGTSYYRLQQTDNDGNSTNSILRPISIMPEKMSSFLSVFPNPASQSFTLTLQLLDESDSRVGIEITNILGKKVVEKKNKKLSNHFLQEIIDVSTLSNGVYFIKVLTANEQYMQKLIISK